MVLKDICFRDALVILATRLSSSSNAFKNGTMLKTVYVKEK